MGLLATSPDLDSERLSQGMWWLMNAKAWHLMTPSGLCEHTGTTHVHTTNLQKLHTYWRHARTWEGTSGEGLGYISKV